MFLDITRRTICVLLLTRGFILCEGFIVDRLVGDPHSLWHPVQGIGKLIEVLERGLRKLFGIEWNSEKGRVRRKKNTRKLSASSVKRRSRIAGVLLAVIVVLISTFVPTVILFIAHRIHPALYIVISCIFSWQLLAAGSLRSESMKVYEKLDARDTEGARYAVSMIVGRDTQSLTEEGIMKAAVETVAENTTDGVTAPLLYMVIFGIPGGFFYKAVSTMDSMIGYRNERYKWFGTAGARMDDVLNYLPSRLTALYMSAAAYLLAKRCGTDGENALRIWRRDRRKHASPNSAQTEAACAGALHLKLAGDAYYGGVLHKKPTIGDPDRRIEKEDIPRACTLMYMTAVLFLADCMLWYVLIGMIMIFTK